MSDKLGPLTLGQKQDQVFLGRDFAAHPDYSPEIAYEIDKEIRRLVDEAYDKARKILEEEREKLDDIARMLVEKETLERNELEELLKGEEPASQIDEPEKSKEVKRDLKPKMKPAEEAGT